jgi:hypothetical protein
LQRIQIADVWVVILSLLHHGHVSDTYSIKEIVVLLLREVVSPLPFVALVSAKWESVVDSPFEYVGRVVVRAELEELEQLILDLPLKDLIIALQ